MRVEDALRQIRLLRKVIPENGAFDAEAETAEVEPRGVEIEKRRCSLPG